MRASPLLLGLILALSACKEKAESPPSLAISTTALDFGEVPLDSSASLDFTLSNMGGGEIEILSISLIDGDDDLWTVARGDLADLGAGQSGTVTISFTPEDEGAEDGRIQIRSSDADNPNLYVDLSGSGAPSTADNDGDGYSAATGDCDDGNASVYPGASEACDGKDNNCDGTVPANEADADYDGYRLCQDDCDDGDSAVYPGADEICDDKDSDCDGVEADRDDLDRDGFTVCDGDCDDGDRHVYPSAEEVCDGADNDCTGEADDVDLDGDGHSPCSPGGDCDDEDAGAYPVVVDEAAEPGGDGTDAAPFDALESAVEALDGDCNTVVLLPGSYTVSVGWSSGELRVEGGGDDPSEVVLTASEGARMFDVTSGASLTLADLTLSGGRASGDGGAVRAVRGSIALVGVVATDNQSTGDGGAVAVSSGTLTVWGSTFTSNAAEDDGGAISVVSGALQDSGGSVYEGNSAVRGGAITVEASSADIEDAEFWSNEAEDVGGAIALTAATGLRLTRGTLASNSAGTTGGALSFADVNLPDGIVQNLFIQDNEAGSEGGGVAITGSSAALWLVNNTLTGNRASGEGGGVYVEADDASSLNIWSNLVIASFGDSGLYTEPGSGAWVAWCTAYLTSSRVEFAGDASAGSDENEEENPLFADFSNDGDPSNDDLSLQSSSPARDSGPTDSAWNDPDGTRNDRGATGGQEATP